MSVTPELTVNLMALFGLLTFGAIAAIFVWPRLAKAERRDALAALLLFSAFRYTALEFMNHAVAPDLPASWSSWAAPGDIAVGMLALVAAIAGRFHRGAGTALAWLYAIAGSADFAIAGSHAGPAGVPATLGAAWPVLSIGGPAWIVTLVLLFVTLVKNRNLEEASR